MSARSFLRALQGLAGLAVLFVLFVASLFLCEYFSVPLPPALVGIFLLFTVFMLNAGVPRWMTPCLDILLKHMALFLIPAVLAVLLYTALFYTHALAFFAAIALSTIISLGITAKISQYLLRRARDGE